MTTTAKMALDELPDKDDFRNHVGHESADYLYVYGDTIRAALKVLDEVQKYPVSSGSTWNDAVAHTINHLKQIAGE